VERMSSQPPTRPAPIAWRSPRTISRSSNLAFLDTFAVFCIKRMFTASSSYFGAYHPLIIPIILESECP
jgi:hypothetical protein